MSDIKKASLQKKIELGNWLALVLFFALSFIFLSREFALGVLFGGLISTINFYWLGKDLRNIFELLSGGVQQNKTKRYVLFRHHLRLIVTGIALYFVITRMSVDVIGLVLGLSLVVVNIIFAVLYENLKKNLKEVQKERCIPCCF